ncbi:hypothetical protein MKL29_02970 [Streptococcus suis]|nr:hypothetical protein [Streptococcus suis]
MTILVLIMLGFYLTLVTISAVLGSLGAKIITTRNMLLTIFSVLVIIAFTYIYLGMGNDSGIYGIAGGLFGLSGIALSNAALQHQRPTLTHHLIRMLLNVAFLLALYLVR